MIHLSVREIVGQIPLEASTATSVLRGDFQIFLPDQVAEPADNTWEEIRWYLEDYARRDIFAFGRAQSAERSLKSSGLSIALAISNSDATLKGIKNSSLLVLVEYKTEFTPR